MTLLALDNMNIEEFGKTIKQKHPQYNDLSDKDLGEKMLAKYPQYKDMVDSFSVSEPEKPSLAYRAGKAIAPLGETIGRTAGIKYAQKLQKPLEENQKVLFENVMKKLKDPNISKERKQFYVDKLKEINPDLVSQIPELKETMEKSTRQVAGEAAITGLNVFSKKHSFSSGYLSVISCSYFIETIGRGMKLYRRFFFISSFCFCFGNIIVTRKFCFLVIVSRSF